MKKEAKTSLLKKRYAKAVSNDDSENVIALEAIDKNKHKIKELKFEIKSCRDSIKRLFAFATGEKSLQNRRIPIHLQKNQRTEVDDRRMLKTVAYLRNKIGQFEQEIVALRRKAK